MGELKLLIRKDCMVLWATMKFYLLFLGALGALVSFIGVSAGMSFYPILLVYLTCYGLASLEEQSCSSTLAFSLPVDLSQVVAARYLTVFVECVAFSLVFWVINLAGRLVGMTSRSIGAMLLFYLAVSLALVSIMLPLIYYFGVMRSRMAIMAVYLVGFLGSGLLTGLYTVGGTPSVDPTATAGLFHWGVLAAAGVLFLLSYRFSTLVAYKRRGL